MRILFCSFQYPPQLGGQARLSADVVRALRGELSVSVATSVRNDPGEPDVAPILDDRRTILANAVTMRRRLGVAYDRIVAADCDISGQIASRYARWTGIQCIYMAHGLDLQRWRVPSFARRVEKRLFAKHLTVIANSERTRAEAEEILAPRHVRVIRPGIDLRGTEPLDDREPRPDAGPLRLLTVARLVRRKGHEHVLRALAGFDRPYRYTIVGDGPERARLEALATRLGIAERVEFLGAVDDVERDACYRRSDVFVMTPYEIATPHRVDYEGFGIVYLEANAHGLPVVAAASGGVPDAVADGTSGLLVAPECPDAIRTALRRLADDAVLRSRLADGARRQAANFDWRIRGAEYVDAFRAAISVDTAEITA